MSSTEHHADQDEALRASILELLPRLPDAVVDDWMLDMARGDIWPPAGPRWYARLAGFSVEQWRNFNWTHEQVDIYKVPFSDDARQIIIGLNEANFGGAVNGYSNVMNSASRMRAIYQHIKATRLLPKSLILIDDSKWEIVDGCHRVTMYAAWLRHPELEEGIERKQSAWVARRDDR